MAKDSKQPFDGKAVAARLPTRPGIYLMKDADNTPLYVGKAKNLRKRVGSYFDARPKVERIMRMVARINQIEVSLTRTEGEALLLENEWIKSLMPRYNVLLRDDKSYPLIVISSDHEFPQIAFHRGARDKKKTYFGPYPSASSVRESINLIQKLFRIRNCEDSYFSHRNRPCLQYQIRRCTAPCVGLVRQQDYADQVKDATLFLQGKNQKVLTRMISRMEQAAAVAGVRDSGHVPGPDQRTQTNAGPAICIRQATGHRFYCVEPGAEAGLCAACIRPGRQKPGATKLFPQPDRRLSRARGVGSLSWPVLPEAASTGRYRHLTSLENEHCWRLFSPARPDTRFASSPIPRGQRRKMLESAVRNSRQALQMRLAGKANMASQFEALQNILKLEETPGSVECFDISHTAGNQTVGPASFSTATGRSSRGIAATTSKGSRAATTMPRCTRCSAGAMDESRQKRACFRTC